MLKYMTKLLHISAGFDLGRMKRHIWPAPWEIAILASFLAGVGSGWRMLASQPERFSPLAAAATTLLLTYAGWYIWGFFTYLTDSVLFGGHSDYRGTLEAFGPAYGFQALLFFSFTRPLGWLWGWIALYATVAAWGIVGPWQLGMRSWRAIVTAALGMLLWLACLLILMLTLNWDGVYVGLGALLA